MSEPRWTFPGILRSRVIDNWKEWYVVVKYTNKDDKYMWLKEGSEYIVSSDSLRLVKSLGLKEGSPVNFLIGEYSSHIPYTKIQCPCCGDYNLRPEDYLEGMQEDLDIKK